MTRVGMAGAVLAGLTLVTAAPGRAATGVELVPVGTYASSSGGVATGTEIVAFDPGSDRAFSTNGAGLKIDITDVSDPAAPTFVSSIDITPYGTDIQSVAAKNGVVAAAIKGTTTQAPGVVALFTTNGAFLRQATVGALPDSVAFTPDGKRVVVVNEGEPACTTGQDPATATNPEGSISIVKVATGVVKTATFTSFNDDRAALLAAGVRLNWPGATVAQDLEPEYAAIKDNGLAAYVTLQEANAIARVDILSATVTDIFPLGSVDHAVAGNGIDPSDRDSATNGKALAIVNRPVSGLHMPDGISRFKVNGAAYYATANEGDARDYPCFVDEARVSAAAVVLDPTAYPDAATLKGDGIAGIGRLNVTRTDGDTDGDGDIDRLTAYGTRSVSVFDAQGTRVFDSADDIERYLEASYPAFFNGEGTAASWDTRSDNKGPEPESVVSGTVGGTPYVFAGLERIGGVMAFNAANPAALTIADYANPRLDGDVIGAADLSPEGLVFVSAADSPNGVPLLLAAHEVSGTVTIFEIRPAGDV
jgi:uncharacterized protein